MLKHLLAPDMPDTSLLRAWRKQALATLLRVLLILGLLPVFVDIFGSFQRGQIEHIAFNIVFYLLLLVFTFVRPFSFDMRVTIFIGLWLGFNCYILMTVGLISSGRVSILANIMLSALLLGRRQAIVTWLLGALGIGLSLAYFQLQPANTIAAVAVRMHDPNTLLTQGLITVALSGFLASLALWLIFGFSQSLLAARQALAERDALNATLERRVAERTAELEQALDRRASTDDALKRQLQSQAAIARSSQLLLGSAITDDAQRHMLTTAIESLYATINPRPIYVLRNVEGDNGELLFEIAIRVGASGSSRLLDQPVSWNALPASIRHTLESGDLWTGPIQSPLSTLPWLQQIAQEQALHSVLCFPIFVDKRWWGAIFFAGDRIERAWGAYETLLLHTIAEMIGATIKRWQAEAGLSQQLRYAEVLAHCSQLLLDGGGKPAARAALVRQMLDSLRAALDASHVLLYQNSNTPIDGLPYTILAVSYDSRLRLAVPPSPEQIADVPDEIVALLAAGQIFNGPVVERFPANPRFQETFDQNGIQSALIIPITIDDHVWGMIEATDCAQARSWDAPSVQLLRTAAEMLASAQQGWEAARTLAERERFIRRVMRATPDIIYLTFRECPEQFRIFPGRFSRFASWSEERLAYFGCQAGTLVNKPIYTTQGKAI